MIGGVIGSVIGGVIDGVISVISGCGSFAIIGCCTIICSCYTIICSVLRQMASAKGMKESELPRVPLFRARHGGISTIIRLRAQPSRFFELLCGQRLAGLPVRAASACSRPPGDLHSSVVTSCSMTPLAPWLPHLSIPAIWVRIHQCLL